MSAETAVAPSPDSGAVRSRSPRRLVLTLLGELTHLGWAGPMRTTSMVDALQSAGVAGSATRAALDRFVLRGLLTRERVGRPVEYRLTPAAHAVLGDAASRVHAEDPFSPGGDGWTLVTFSVPEEQRGLRHQLRTALTWEGFGPLRDGLWIASGERDAGVALGELRNELPGSELLAFHARDLAGFPVAEALSGAWDLEAIAAAHEGFLAEWADRSDGPNGARVGESGTLPALAQLIRLVADWLDLLRQDPRLPADLLGPDWPAQRSLALYRQRRVQLEAQAEAAMRDFFDF